MLSIFKDKRSPEEIQKAWDEAKDFGEKSLKSLMRKKDPDKTVFQYLFNRIFNRRKPNWAIVIEGKFIHKTGLTKEEADRASYIIDDSEVVYKPCD